MPHELLLRLAARHRLGPGFFPNNRSGQETPRDFFLKLAVRPRRRPGYSPAKISDQGMPHDNVFFLRRRTQLTSPKTPGVLRVCVTADGPTTQVYLKDESPVRANHLGM